MLSRRALLAGWLGCSAAPRPAAAQQLPKVPRIGILANYRFGKPDLWESFVQGLRELGYTEGQNITIEWRVSEGRYERLPAQAAELARSKVDVIVVPANQNALAAKEATPAIPIVMIGVTDPVGSGFVKSLARPGGNMTGLSGSVGPEFAGKQLELLKAAVPQASRVAVVWNPGNPAHALMLKVVRGVASSLAVQVQALEARGPDDFPSVFTAMARERAGAVLVLGDGMFSLHLDRMVDLVAKSRLPTMGSRPMVPGGALMSYQTSSPELWRRAATYVDKILKGARPADLPVELPTNFDLAINLKVARALRLTIPSSLLARADETIE